MCGILATFNYRSDQSQHAFRNLMLSKSKSIRHRGPDASGIYMEANDKTFSAICHERLAIVGDLRDTQPFKENGVVLAVNGEIYNHKEIRSSLGADPEIYSSDCDVLIPVYEKYKKGKKISDLLNGIFAFVLYDSKDNKVIVARDPFGVIPLYQGWNSNNGSVWFASELKALESECDYIRLFPPGKVLEVKFDQEYYLPEWKAADFCQTVQEDELYIIGLRERLMKSVKDQLMSDAPFGVLLSGGLDSSLIASIASRFVPKGTLHSFSIGLPGSPDLEAARKVAEYLGTIHTEFHFTLQQGFDAIRDVIYHIESYDVTTVRASTPMYLLSRMVKSLGIKMVLSGEGADELFGGYLYFHDAPDDLSFLKECKSRVLNLHTSDCLRANKSTMANGLEARVPFLDKDFVDFVFDSLPSISKMPSYKGIEKWILRKAFDDQEYPFLPSEILWRQKEQFSDGVGYGWIDFLRDQTSMLVTDDELQCAKYRYKVDPPSTKEGVYYRKIFEELFTNPASIRTVKRWIPRMDWGCSEDPSGRAQSSHNSSYIEKKTKIDLIK
ncbi:asparagine synthase [Rozella allomycis CSF55]|uniref:asparagine synthase (glutamine-hydrolyzing) n=1 Tax=Rozella allomycis (strain CSF55) TaxID=988480 RepID=A0A4P9YGP9_ROZAC|nr:asparagine synthase [Rozella allomycis CSF55]